MNDHDLTLLERRVTATTRPVPALFTYYCLVSLASGPWLPFVLLALYFRYHSLRYSFDADGISMRYGVLFRREVHLTYGRMQDIHLSQNVVERWLGIGQVTVQTAGGGSGSDLSIVGVTNFEAIRDYLYSRMRGMRERAPTAPAGLPTGSVEARLLSEIRDELRATTRALTASRGGTEVKPS